MNGLLLIVSVVAQSAVGEDPRASFEGHTADEWIRALAESKLPNEIFGRADAKRPGEALRVIGPAAIPAALEALRDPRGDLRAAAVDVLADLGPKARPALPALLDLVKTGKPWTRAAAAETLARLGPMTGEVIPAIADLLKSPGEALRGAAADALRVMGPEARDALPALREAVRHEQGVTRVKMAHAMVRLDPKDPAGPAALIDMLRPAAAADAPILSLTGDSRIVLNSREAAAEALGDLGPAATSAVPALIEAIPSDYQVRLAAIRALGNIGPGAKQAIPSLLKVLGTAAAGPPDLASQALIAIQPDRSVAPELIAIMRKEQPADLRIGNSAAAVFQAIGPDAIPDLVPLLHEPDARLRALAIEALGAIGPGARSTVPLIIASMRDGDPGVRIAAANTLGRIGPEPADDVVSPLLVALDDENPRVAVAVVSALGVLGPEAKAARTALLAKLGDPRWRSDHRSLVTSLLKVDPDARHDAVVALLTALKTSDPEKKRDAFFTLAEAIDVRPEKDLVVPVLLEALRSPQRDFAAGAVPLLKKLGAEDELLPLTREWLGSSDPVRRLEALRTLAYLGAKAGAAAPGVRALLKDRDLMTRCMAAVVLLKRAPDDEDAQDVLLSVLEDPKANLGQINSAGVPLGALAKPTRATLPRLVRCLEHTPDRQSQAGAVHIFALRALGRGGAAASEAIPRMIELLGDRDKSVCVAAAEALGSLGPLAKDAIPALRKIASHPRPSTPSGVAADALKKIETPR